MLEQEARGNNPFDEGTNPFDEDDDGPVGHQT